MPKTRSPINVASPPPPRGRTGAALAILFFLAAVAPLYEVTLRIVARWRGLYGQVPTVRTPVLDSFASMLADAARAVHVPIRQSLHGVPWNADAVIVLGFVWAMVAVFILKKSHPR